MLSKERTAELKKFLKLNKLKCNNLETLDIALTHGSYTFENKLDDKYNYERLEFLGDAVVKLSISDHLYEKYPQYKEGELTKIRSVVVSDRILAKLAEKIDIGKYIKLGYHEEKQGGRKRQSTYACAFEALLGALYLDGKLELAKDFLKVLINDYVEIVDNDVTKANFKAMLQEYSQGKGIGLPEYLTKEEKGPAHAKTFEIEVKIQGQLLGTGIGKTKKQAQQNAAHSALLKLGLIKENQSE